MANIEDNLVNIIVFGAAILDTFGAIVIVIVSARALMEFFIRFSAINYDTIRLDLIRGLALGLEFKIGSSILRTVAVTNLFDVELLAAILLIRTFLVFVIRRELKDTTEKVTTDGNIETGQTG